jgi:hypothetical protein
VKLHHAHHDRPPDVRAPQHVVSDGFPMYRSFQRKTERLIPLFVLEPAG